MGAEHDVDLVRLTGRRGRDELLGRCGEGPESAPSGRGGMCTSPASPHTAASNPAAAGGANCVSETVLVAPD